MTQLLLTLKKEPFDLMAAGLKPEEFRSPSKWIVSRLVGKHYDTVKFTNGYGHEKPWFIAEYKGFYIASICMRMEYPGGFAVLVASGDYVIKLGRVLSTGNIK